MSLIKGKVVKVTFNGADVPFKNFKEGKSHKELDMTDNSSVGDGLEKAVGRFTQEFEVTGILQKTGVKQVAKNVKLTYNSIEYKTTDLSYEETFAESDRTSGSTTGDGTEVTTTFAERKFSATVWKEDSQADPPTGVEHASTLFFATGITVTCAKTVMISKDSDGEVKGDVKLNVSGSLNGAVVETAVGLTGATSATMTITYADGTVSDKAVTGTAILMSKKISGNIESELAYTYRFKFTGTPTESEKADA